MHPKLRNLLDWPKFAYTPINLLFREEQWGSGDQANLRAVRKLKVQSFILFYLHDFFTHNEEISPPFKKI